MRAETQPVTIDAFAVRLLDWFDAHGRHDLPWQHPRSPYRVWLSEVMLQQTQVRTVIPYFQRFVDQLPDLASLAAAPPDQVLALWSGLGYYSRARNLHAAAQRCMAQHAGELPRDVASLAALPGIGRSTAAAIAAQAWNVREPILDGNVRRLLARYHGVEGWPGNAGVERTLWAFATTHVSSQELPVHRIADYTQAQMDLGATVCTRSRPACTRCPLQSDCVAYQDGRTASLPTPRPTRTLPHRDAHVLLLRNASGEVLLERKPPTGIWASLWSLPQFESGDAADAWLATRFGSMQARSLPDIEHAFSHYRLTLAVTQHDVTVGDRRVAEDADQRWVDARTLVDLGIPAPIRRLLERTLQE